MYTPMYQSNMLRIPSCNATVGNNKDSISLSEFLKSVFSRIQVKTTPKSPVPWPKTPEPTSRPIQPNPFNKLPFEIWLDILERLPLPSAASLAYTCRYMHEGFGPKYYTHLKPPQNISAKIELLTCLDPSLPMHRLCNVCAIFHRQLSAKEAQEAVRNNHEGTWGSCPDVPRRILVGKGYSLPWPAIESVMRAYRYGAEYGIPLDTLAQHWESGNGWDNRSEASIVDGRLLVKVMNVRAVDESARLMISGTMSQSWLGHLDEIVECTLEHVGSGRPRANQHCICTNLNRFKRGPAKYMIEIKRLNELHRDLRRKMKKMGAKQVLVLSTWRGCGEGKSPL